MLTKSISANLGRARRENISPEVTTLGLSLTKFERHNHQPNIFTYISPTHVILNYHVVCRSTSYSTKLSSYSLICFQLVQCRYMSFFVRRYFLIWCHHLHRTRTTLPDMHGSMTLLLSDHSRHLKSNIDTLFCRS